MEGSEAVRSSIYRLAEDAHTVGANTHTGGIHTHTDCAHRLDTHTAGTHVRSTHSAHRDEMLRRRKHTQNHTSINDKVLQQRAHTSTHTRTHTHAHTHGHSSRTNTAHVQEAGNLPPPRSQALKTFSQGRADSHEWRSKVSSSECSNCDVRVFPPMFGGKSETESSPLADSVRRNTSGGHSRTRACTRTRVGHNSCTQDKCIHSGTRNQIRHTPVTHKRVNTQIFKHSGSYEYLGTASDDEPLVLLEPMDSKAFSEREKGKKTGSDIKTGRHMKKGYGKKTEKDGKKTGDGKSRGWRGGLMDSAILQRRRVALGSRRRRRKPDENRQIGSPNQSLQTRARDTEVHTQSVRARIRLPEDVSGEAACREKDKGRMSTEEQKGRTGREKERARTKIEKKSVKEKGVNEKSWVRHMLTVWKNAAMLALTLRVISPLGWIVFWNMLSFWLFYVFVTVQAFFRFRRLFKRHALDVYSLKTGGQESKHLGTGSQIEKLSLLMQEKEWHKESGVLDKLITVLITCLCVLFPFGGSGLRGFSNISLKRKLFRRYLSCFPLPFVLSSHDYFWVKDTCCNSCQIVGMAICDRLSIEELRAAVRSRFLPFDPKLQSVNATLFGRRAWLPLPDIQKPFVHHMMRTHKHDTQDTHVCASKDNYFNLDDHCYETIIDTSEQTVHEIISHIASSALPNAQPRWRMILLNPIKQERDDKAGHEKAEHEDEGRKDGEARTSQKHAGVDITDESSVSILAMQIHHSIGDGAAIAWAVLNGLFEPRVDPPVRGLSFVQMVAFYSLNLIRTTARGLQLLLYWGFWCPKPPACFQPPTARAPASVKKKLCAKPLAKRPPPSGAKFLSPPVLFSMEEMNEMRELCAEISNGLVKPTVNDVLVYCLTRVIQDMRRGLAVQDLRNKITTRQKESRPVSPDLDAVSVSPLAVSPLAVSPVADSSPGLSPLNGVSSWVPSIRARASTVEPGSREGSQPRETREGMETWARTIATQSGETRPMSVPLGDSRRVLLNAWCGEPFERDQRIDLSTPTNSRRVYIGGKPIVPLHSPMHPHTHAHTHVSEAENRLRMYTASITGDENGKKQVESSPKQPCACTHTQSRGVAHMCECTPCGVSRRAQSETYARASACQVEERVRSIYEAAARRGWSRSEEVLQMMIPVSTRTSVPSRLDNFTGPVLVTLPLPIAISKKVCACKKSVCASTDIYAHTHTHTYFTAERSISAESRSLYSTCCMSLAHLLVSRVCACMSGCVCMHGGCECMSVGV